MSEQGVDGSEPVAAVDPLPVTKSHEDVDERLPKVFWPALIIGWTAIAVGLFGAFGKIHHFAGTVAWQDVGKWTIGLAIVHDLLIAPAICIVGLIVSRAVPSRIRAPIQAGLIVSAFVILAAWPVFRVGVPLSNNPSILPGNYGRGLLIVLAVVWFVTLAFILWTLVSGRSQPSHVEHRPATDVPGT